MPGAGRPPYQTSLSIAKHEVTLERRKRVEAEKRAVAAERNAAQWHALLLCERIRNLPKRAA